MKKLAFALAASVALFTTAASAQDRGDRGDRDYRYETHRDWDRGDRDRRYERRGWEDRDRGSNEGRAVRRFFRGMEEATGAVGPCRIVTVRRYTPDGDLIVRRIRRCY